MLKEKKEFYKVCFDTMQVGILVCNEQKEIVLENNPLNSIFGYQNNELHGLSTTDILKDIALFNDFIQHPKNQKYKVPIESIGVKKNGQEIPIELTFGKLEYENQFYYKALISDISERKEKEKKITTLNYQLEEEVKNRNNELEKVVEQLKKSLNKEIELNHLKTKFIALASHEFKTPLSAILSSTELIVKYTELEKYHKRDTHVAKVKSMIHHLNGMLDDFLTLENIESGNIKPCYTPLNLNKLIKEITKFTKPSLKKGQVLIFENQIDEEIYQDPKLLKIILTNLLYNAIKYSDEESEIHVKISQNKNNIYFSVKDYGIGIPEAEQNLIFNRFFRAKNVLYYPGTGIGLNIVKGYVTSLKGTISFVSKENKGTSFKIQLPKITIQ
ncbi:ATP-binding protein [Lutibacter aestuarii]|uniref:histidine kinase n=1 Tax=Lutibacter aestuarii TaxID=861111 RepID=A0ABW2Z5Y6_9FLAO|nr:PAS domain-containing sensor histidine kinase [uncultured Lutibacter sp.]